MSQNKAAQLKKEVAPYERTDVRKSVIQLVNTIVPLLVFWYLAYASLAVSYWLTLAFAFVAAGFVIRTFIIFHDCCHGSFFKNRLANDIVGTLTGILTVVPYRQWKHSHSVHHATSGNLDKRGVGDIWVMTVKEYMEASPWRRLQYRLYRNPLVMFGIGPTFTFLIEYRFNRRGARWPERLNTYLTNASIAALYAVLCWAIGWEAFLLVQGPIFLVSGLIGVWLFYVQHQFEDSYFEPEHEWSYVKAAVEGSSYYKLPKPLQWITGNIGFHHVHHLAPKVPNYLLEEAHRSTPPLQQATTIDLRGSLQSLKFRLWDEDQKKFISFGDLRRERRAQRNRPSFQGE
ncbi:fatty acid desaturase [Paenibacillus sp.]|uniref:fatty acid desaturase n=1 Tax=Paenibacillus sp. TaxID=58172 RepID=UPI002D686A5B|nr:fatty acid desaturase [Paenibacillus sp.]HZG86415.1 fatty acid desaturase [Paenibacillus sp.]